MDKFRKKPVVIEAMQFDGSEASGYKIDDWANGSTRHLRVCNEITINTLEGEMRGMVGDWIIRGIKGEFYPCKPDIFEATYEPVNDTEEGE